MKKLLFTTLFFLISLTIFGQTNYCSKYDKELIIQKQYLTISYNKKDKIPNYVGYFIVPENMNGDVSRESTFYSEDAIPKTYRAYSSNYTNSGYDRGHMSPAANWNNNSEAMHESFSMANICPQRPTLNRRYWLALENLEREYSEECDTLFVITGEFSDNSVYIKNKVRVPDYFYKAVVGVKDNTVIISSAWIYRNSNDKQTTDESKVRIEYIEEILEKKLFQGFWFKNYIE